VYKNRVYHGFGHPHPEQKLSFGPNIADWPAMTALPDNLILTVASAIYDPVTTTDELIPSGETSSYRSNPLRLAEFALSRKDPDYVGRAKAVHALEQERLDFIAQGKTFEGSGSAVERLFQELHLEGLEQITGIGSVLFAVKPGDGSAREQAASSQKVLGGWANIAEEYATKRYRSNLVNWGMLPFVLPGGSMFNFKPGDRVFIPGIRGALASGADKVMGFLHRGDEEAVPLKLLLPAITDEERAIILAGCLINFYAGEE
jgi:aconitate hydratase